MAQTDAARCAGKVVFTPDMEGDWFPEVWVVDPSTLGPPGQVVLLRDPERVQFVRPIPIWPLWDALASATALQLFLGDDPSADVWELLFPAFGRPITTPLEAP